MSDVQTADAVSVHYAREQYALGYFHGRNNDPGADPRAAFSFARFYTRQCARDDHLVDVQHAYQQWQAERAEVAAEIRYDRTLDYASNYEDD